MCYPILIPIAMAAVSAATTVAQQMQTNQTAKSQARAAREAEAADMGTLDLRANQINIKGMTESMAIRRQALKERGSLIAAQTESGFTGASPFRELLNQQLKADEAISGSNYNTQNALVQNATDRAGVSATARGRINEAYSRVPAGMLAGLQIAGAGASGAAQGYSMYSAMKGK